MGNAKVNDILIPQVTTLPGKGEQKTNVGNEVERAEFQSLLKEKINQTEQKHGISLSLHAAKRMKERNLEMDSSEFFKLKDAMEKLRAKGGQDSLVITPQGAYIVDVGNNKVVTAIDRENMNENVFTKIDSTVILN